MANPMTKITVQTIEIYDNQRTFSCSVRHIVMTMSATTMTPIPPIRRGLLPAFSTKTTCKGFKDWV